MEKQVIAFSKFVVEIKSRKSKSEIFRFAELSPEKGSSDDCHVIEKAKSKKIETDTENKVSFF